MIQRTGSSSGVMKTVLAGAGLLATMHWRAETLPSDDRSES
jgi:hypothetical protein